MNLPRHLALALSLSLAAAPAFAAPACTALARTADARAEELLPRQGFQVSGRGRLHFHSAPSASCGTKAFVVPGDTLVGYQTFQDWTYVMYVHPVTGDDTSGWVPSARLRESGTLGDAGRTR